VVEQQDDHHDGGGGAAAAPAGGGIRSSSSMVQEVCTILKEYGNNAKATFFVCTDYTKVEEAQIVLQNGHELGNHLQKDVSGYYCNLSKQDFRTVLLEANQFLEQDVLFSSGSITSTTVATDENDTEEEENTIISPQLVDKHPHQSSSTKIKWFRAPQGRMSVAMQEVLAEEGMVNVMGDCYCDDWSFTEAYDKAPAGTIIDDDITIVADLMLQQVQPGSIAILHMPERGFRESMTIILKAFLKGCQEKNLRCVTVSELVRRYNL
jgi:peptidoglycan/xylan/chitin deacetylase (PgdA/CDA1 family)